MGGAAGASSASDAASADNFGLAVAISGDRVLVGAWGNDDGGLQDSGSAYLYDKAGVGAWSLTVKLVADDAVANDRFGFSVGLSGDTALIGAYANDAGTGKAYVYEATGGGAWPLAAKLVAADAEPVDQFGWAVAVAVDRHGALDDTAAWMRCGRRNLEKPAIIPG